MMVDFNKNFNNYIKSPMAHTLGISNTKGNGVNFIKAAIMSVFDGNSSKSAYKDGKIDSKEFYKISEKDYEALTKQMKSYYKAQNNRELEYHIPSYEELEQMLLDGQSNEVKSKQQSIKTAAQEITLDEIEEPIVPNKTIGQVNQKYSGECYQDASDIALSFNKRGLELLSRSVSHNLVDGGYDVTLYGAKKNGEKQPVTYHFTRQQLREAQEKMIKLKDGTTGKKYSAGDANVVLLDLAVEKYRKENNHKLLHRNTKAAKGYDDYLSSGFIHDNLELITGKQAKTITYSGRSDIEKTVEGKTVKTHTYLNRAGKEKKLDAFLKFLDNNPDRTVGGCTFGVTKEGNWKEFKEYDLYEGHAFAIAKVDLKNGVVYIANSHSSNSSKGLNSETIKPIPVEVFKRYVATSSWINV